MKLLRMALVLALAAPCLVFGQNVEQELIKLENAWNDAVVKRDAAWLAKTLADDYIGTDTEGTVLTKSQEVADLKSGDLAVTSAVGGDYRVRVYGDVAVVTALVTMKGKDKGKDISGPHRYTDTWVKRGGVWQCVASQGTKVVKK